MSAGLAASPRHCSTARRATLGARVVGGSRMSISPPLRLGHGRHPMPGRPTCGPSGVILSIYPAEMGPPVPEPATWTRACSKSRLVFVGSEDAFCHPRSEEVGPVRKSALAAMLVALIASSACSSGSGLQADDAIRATNMAARAD